ncbi:MAG: hypothetical protein DMG13_16700 [Acidobacteria bacterium]|nr:MAG: hypothetical protein DMG13_16700 [Acidobacteriota bacterium]
MFRLQRFTVLITLLSISCALSAQGRSDQPAPSRPLRFDFTPLVGYRIGVNPAIQPAVEGSDARLVFDANPSYGLAFGLRLNEENLVEFRWARQDTRFHLEGALQASIRQRAILDEFHGDFTHEYIPEDWPWVRPFITGSVGATHVSGVEHSSFTRFSFGLGTGIRIFADRHLGFRLQAAWLPIWASPEVKAFVCGSGCVIRLGGKLSSQGEITIGPVLRLTPLSTVPVSSNSSVKFPAQP